MSNTTWAPNSWLCMVLWCYVRGKRSLFPMQFDWNLEVTNPSSHPCVSGEQHIWDPLLLCQVTSSQRRQSALACANKGRPGENASAGSHSHPDNISVPPAPHALTWSSHTDRVANGHFYESKQGRVGHWTSPQRTPCSPINWSLLDLRWWFRATL